MTALAPASARPGGDSRSRGTLTLSDGVVEKIASQVVAEVSDTYGTSRGLLGWRDRVGSTVRPAVDVDLHADFVDLSISVGLVFPVSLRSAADTIRDRVQQRVGDLTGVPVRRVDVRITGLRAGADGRSGGPDPDRELR
ncbi:Asp23/Gls24 family envelope stress response protein [Serinibacter arcticus]|uniref:Alkaline shock protein 23 n=1 Tax=Serinibacter arcticus TaxID=1655435 RepID=A0A4Z1E7J3_9MICO|nr:Asp23/Gls24 family envelope stress response protein [Serinibacter arcticus]TGO05647.1 hypothetical protein SERN_1651 [Serinibacter arcticus]